MTLEERIQNLTFGVEAACRTIDELREVRRALKEALREAVDIMLEAKDLIDTYSDVKDGDNGEQVPNNAMRAQQRLEWAIAKAERARNRH